MSNKASKLPGGALPAKIGFREAFQKKINREKNENGIKGRGGSNMNHNLKLL